MTAAIVVQPLTKDRIVISLSPGYRAVWFKLASGGAELVVLDNHATETTRLQVAPPEPGQSLRITTPDPNIVEILYEAAP
jgi:hypothetical protein